MSGDTKSLGTKLRHFYFGDPEKNKPGYYNPKGFPTTRRHSFRIVAGLFGIILTIAIPYFIWNILHLLWIQDDLSVFWDHIW